MACCYVNQTTVSDIGSCSLSCIIRTWIGFWAAGDVQNAHIHRMVEAEAGRSLPCWCSGANFSPARRTEGSIVVLRLAVRGSSAFNDLKLLIYSCETESRELPRHWKCTAVLRRISRQMVNF